MSDVRMEKEGAWVTHCLGTKHADFHRSGAARRSLRSSRLKDGPISFSSTLGT